MARLSERIPTVALLVGLCLLVSGCLKTHIVTDRTPSSEKAELLWAHGFVNGLVPPVNAPLDTAPVCGEAGVSEVYFRQTFVQGVAQGLTSSLYAPQRFTATCAQGGMSATVLPPVDLPERASGGAPPASAATK